MASFSRKEYYQLYHIASDIHLRTRNKVLKEHAAVIMDLTEQVLGQLYRPQGMRVGNSQQQEKET